VIEVLDGRSRRVIERYLSALPVEQQAAIEVVSIDPYDAYRQAIKAALPHARIVADHFHLVRGANTALDCVRRQRQRAVGRARPQGTRRSGQQARWRPELYHARHRLLKARQRLTEPDRRRLVELFAHEPLIAETWGLKEAFRAVYRAGNRSTAEQRLDAFLLAVGRARIPAFDAFVKSITSWRQELQASFDEPTTNGYAEGVSQQGQGHQAPRLRTAHLHQLPQARRHSTRPTGPRGLTPLNRREPNFRPARCRERRRDHSGA
jgi:transposase